MPIIDRRTLGYFLSQVIALYRIRLVESTRFETNVVGHDWKQGRSVGSQGVLEGIEMRVNPKVGQDTWDLAVLHEVLHHVLATANEARVWRAIMRLVDLTEEDKRIMKRCLASYGVTREDWEAAGEMPRVLVSTSLDPVMIGEPKGESENWICCSFQQILAPVLVKRTGEETAYRCGEAVVVCPQRGRNAGKTFVSKKGTIGWI